MAVDPKHLDSVPLDRAPDRPLRNSDSFEHEPNQATGPVTEQVHVALAGNPNCGKTTLFNGLTGLRYKVANYPGVTVERKRGKLTLPNVSSATLVDLPGIYTLVGSSEDEKIATAVLGGKYRSEPVPDAIVVVIDASNLERNLYLVTQLIDFGIPMLVALNMGDLAEQKGIRVYTEILSRNLDLPVVSIVASQQKGLHALKEEIVNLLRSKHISRKRFDWLALAPKYRDAAEKLGEMQNDDQVGEPASKPSSFPAEQARDKLLIGCNLLSESIAPATPDVNAALIETRAHLADAGIDSFSHEATGRYQWINGVVKRSSVQNADTKPGFVDKLDTVLTHKVWGTLIFFSLMTIIFQSIFLWAQIPMDLIDGAFSSLGQFVGKILPDGQLKSLVTDGIISGVGNVVVFVPQIAILFLFLGALEDTGYLSRAAFIMDRLMRPFGLQGRSFIPLLSSFACAIPGILASRTIPSWADRMATIMVAPLMSCSARLPVYAVLIAAFVPQQFYFGIVSLQGLVLLGMYLLGIIGAAVVAWLLKLSLLHGKPALFVMEMPPIRLPSIRTVLRNVYDRVLTFLKSAGTTILACSIVLWFLASYPRPPEGFEGNAVQQTYAGRIGTAIEPVIKPLGFNWEIGVGLLASFAAREVFISALSTVYNLQDADNTAGTLTETLKGKRSQGSFTTLEAVSLMVFFVFACQCMSTLAVCRRETGSWRWTAFMFVYMTLMAYGASFLTYSVGKFFFS